MAGISCDVGLNHIKTFFIGEAVLPIPSHSHQVVFQPLWKELSLRGHQVTVITTDPINDTSLTNLIEIDVSEAYTHWKKLDLVYLADKTFIEMMYGFIAVSHDTLSEELNHPLVHKLINDPTNQFDVVLVETFYPVMYSFSVRFDCPLIGILSLDAYSKLYENMGNPTHPVIYSDNSLPYTVNLTFWQRVQSTIYGFYIGAIWDYELSYGQENLIATYFGADYPSPDELKSRIQMLFLNTDTVFHPVRPLLPNIIQIGGGTHLKPPKPLPGSLQDELDSAENGVIYFSLGSTIKSEDLDEKVRNVFLETFAELPYKILWKFESKDLPGKPPNVLISDWFPQADVLRHPNVKLFITHGGLQSLEESVYAHVPMIGIPFCADQPKSVKMMVDKGMGLMVSLETLKKDVLKMVILEVITNPKYREKVKYLAELAKDQPMTGLEKAIWWTEYVIRHKGAPHLRSPRLDIPWYQYYMVDVIAVCLLVVLVSLYVLKRFIVWIFRKTLSSVKSKTE